MPGIVEVDVGGEVYYYSGYGKEQALRRADRFHDSYIIVKWWPSQRQLLRGGEYRCKK